MQLIPRVEGSALKFFGIAQSPGAHPVLSERGSEGTFYKSVFVGSCDTQTHTHTGRHTHTHIHTHTKAPGESFTSVRVRGELVLAGSLLGKICIFRSSLSPPSPFLPPPPLSLSLSLSLSPSLPLLPPSLPLSLPPSPSLIRLSLFLCLSLSLTLYTYICQKGPTMSQVRPNVWQKRPSTVSKET